VRDRIADQAGQQRLIWVEVGGHDLGSNHTKVITASGS
jgi:hypothetical protein